MVNAIPWNLPCSSRQRPATELFYASALSELPRIWHGLEGDTLVDESCNRSVHARIPTVAPYLRSWIRTRLLEELLKSITAVCVPPLPRSEPLEIPYTRSVLAP